MIRTNIHLRKDQKEILDKLGSLKEKTDITAAGHVRKALDLYFKRKEIKDFVKTLKGE